MMKQILSLVAVVAMSSTASFAFVPTTSRVVSIASSNTQISAEEKDRDYEAEITKMEKEAMERLEDKTQEMMAKIASTGASN